MANAPDNPGMSTPPRRINPYRAEDSNPEPVPESKTTTTTNPYAEDYYPEQTAMLQKVANNMVSLLQSKDQTYRGSWRKRGGRGAWFTMIRPIDRLEKIVEQHDDDIFKALLDDDAKGITGQDGSVMATLNDIMGYCMLVKAHFLLQKAPYRQVTEHTGPLGNLKVIITDSPPQEVADHLKNLYEQRVNSGYGGTPKAERIFECLNCHKQIRVPWDNKDLIKCTCSAVMAENISKL